MLKTRDIDIRTSLHYFLKREYENDPDALILDELGLCQGEARIDVAVINGSINGFEIKSESDTLERLPKQTEIYNRVFDSVTILTASKFINEIQDIVPNWWGIIRAEKVAESEVHFFSVREPSLNTEIDPFSLAQLLWKDEALEILKERGLQRGYLSKPRSIIWEAIATKLSLDELQYEVRRKLKARQRWRVH